MEDKKTNILDKVKNKNAILISIVIIIIPLLYFFAPMIFDHLRPIGVDSIASSGSTHLYSEWQKDTGETVLWNPNIFGKIQNKTIINIVTNVPINGKK